MDDQNRFDLGLLKDYALATVHGIVGSLVIALLMRAVLAIKRSLRDTRAAPVAAAQRAALRKANKSQT